MSRALLTGVNCIRMVLHRAYIKSTIIILKFDVLHIKYHIEFYAKFNILTSVHFQCYVLFCVLLFHPALIRYRIKCKMIPWYIFLSLCM